MAWTAPMTAVTGNVLTAAQWNQFVRDNLGMTAVANATVEGSFFAGDGLNSIVQRTPDWRSTTGGSTTTSTTYTDLADVNGPSVTVETGPVAMIWLYCNQYNTAGNAAWMAFDVGGASAITATDAFAVQMQGTDGDRVGAGFLLDNLTGGLNTFTAKYRVSTAGTGYFSQRRIVVWPF